MTSVNLWESLGFGKAPFRCIAMFQMPNKERATMQDYQSLPKVSKGGAGCCYVCGTGLVYNYIVEDANGDTFITGCDCVQKTGDKALIKEAKNARRAKRDAEALAKYKAERAAREAARIEDRKVLLQWYGNLFNTVREYSEKSGQVWVLDIVNSAINWGKISDKQLDCLVKFVKDYEHSLTLKNEYFGEVGKRVTVELTVNRWIKISEGNYFQASSYLVLMSDSEGRSFVYMGGGACIPKAGDTVKMKVTIKEHKEYKGTFQTVIQRPALVD